jgi:hypothetical protein
VSVGPRLRRGARSWRSLSWRSLACRDWPTTTWRPPPPPRLRRPRRPRALRTLVGSPAACSCSTSHHLRRQDCRHPYSGFFPRRTRAPARALESTGIETKRSAEAEDRERRAPAPAAARKLRRASRTRLRCATPARPPAPQRSGTPSRTRRRPNARSAGTLQSRTSPWSRGTGTASRTRTREPLVQIGMCGARSQRHCTASALQVANVVRYHPKPYATAKKNATPTTTPAHHQNPKLGLYDLIVSETPSVPLALLAGFPERLPPLPEDHWQHRQSAYGVGPPPAEGSV